MTRPADDVEPLATELTAPETPVGPTRARAGWTPAVLRPLLATTARRRMAAVVSSAFMVGIYAGGIDVILPLWLTRDLGFSAGEWSLLRSQRMLGVLLGVVVLGALSDRFGPRRLTVLSMLATALLLAQIAWCRAAGIWLVMPVFGAIVSTGFVNLNTLTQMVSDRRQGLANTLYRGTGTAAGVLAPILATQLALWWGGYPPVLAVLALAAVVAAAAIRFYPDSSRVRPLADWRTELRGLWQGYRRALARRDLMRFLHLSLLWYSVLLSLGTFAAIRFTRDLKQTDQQFGALAAAAGVAALVATLAVGVVLDRLSLRSLHTVLAAASSVCVLAMGLTDSAMVSATAFVAFGLLTGPIWGPMSMWVSRAAGPGGQTAAFTVQKVLTALYGCLATALLSVLEGVVGIRWLFLVSGSVGLVLGLAFLLLAEPPRSSQAAANGG